MRLSIVTITRNHRSGLNATKDSILAQTHPPYEWIVIDGASRDGSIADLEALSLPYFQYISEQDAGIYDAMNKGLHLTKGDYVLFLNAGDCLADQTTLANLITYQTTDTPILIYGDSWEESHYKPARAATNILWGMFTHHQAILYRRTALALISYDTRYKIAADYDATLRLLLDHPKTCYLPQPICRFEAGGLSQRQVRHGRLEQFYSRAQHKATPFWKNCFIYAAQTSLFFVRTHVPAIYWYIKNQRL